MFGALGVLIAPNLKLANALLEEVGERSGANHGAMEIMDRIGGSILRAEEAIDNPVDLDLSYVAIGYRPPVLGEAMEAADRGARVWILPALLATLLRVGLTLARIVDLSAFVAGQRGTGAAA